MSIWQKNNRADKRALIQRTEEMEHIHPIAVEKDWWVTAILKALFQTSCSEHLIFKGGTSLSKGWTLIERFSEDIDLAIDHRFFGIEKTTKSQREKLRKKSREYIMDILAPELDNILRQMGISDFSIEKVETVLTKDGAKPVDSDKDPTVLLVHFDSILEDAVEYIPPQVKIEISCLSMNEPTELKHITSLICKHYPGEDDETTCDIRTVVPTRTFLEKAFLLNEEFQKEHPRSRRMSRHLYDLEKLMDTPFGRQGLQDGELYAAIVKHRSQYYALKYIDYQKHHPSVIRIVPPEEVLDEWGADYEQMCNSFIYGNKLPFDDLLNRIVELQERFREVKTVFDL